MAIVLFVKPKISKMKFRGNSVLHCVLEHVYCFLRRLLRGKIAPFCLSLIKNVVFVKDFSANFYCPKLARSRLSHMLFNSEALFEEDGSIDHHVDVILWLG